MPYELTEYGWGEFEASIRIHFRDSSEKIVEIFHPVKLFDQHGEIVSIRPVVYEFYDEIVFQDPYDKLLRLLRRTPHGAGLKLKESSLSPYCKFFFGFFLFLFVMDGGFLRVVEEFCGGLLDNSTNASFPFFPFLFLLSGIDSKIDKDFSDAEDKDKEKIEAARKKIRERINAQQQRYEELEDEREKIIREILSRGGKV